MVFSILAMMKNRKHTGTPWQIMAHYGTLPSNTRDFRLIFSQQDQSSEWFLSSCIVFSSGLQRRRSFDLTHEPWGYFPKSLWSPSESSTHMVQVSKNNLYHCILVLYPLANSHSYGMLSKMNEDGLHEFSPWWAPWNLTMKSPSLHDDVSS